MADPEILSFHSNLLKSCFENFQYELNNIKKSMSKLSEHKIMMLEQDLQAKKKQFSNEIGTFEKKIADLENQLYSLKKKSNNKKSIQCQTVESLADMQENKENLENLKREYERKNTENERKHDLVSLI